MGDLSTMQATLRYLRSGSSKKRNLGALALLVMFAAGTPAPAADTIEELLREDEASSQNDALRVDLNALTEAEWEYYFQVGLKKVDTQLVGKLVEQERLVAGRCLCLDRSSGRRLWHRNGRYQSLAQHAPRIANTAGPGSNGGPGPRHCRLCGVRRDAALTPLVARG